MQAKRMRIHSVFMYPAPLRCGLLNLPEDAFEIDLFLLHIFDLARARGLTFDRDGSAITELVQLCENHLEVDEPVSDKDLFSQLVGIRGPLAVLGVNAADVRSENVYRVDRIRLAIEDQVCRVQ